MVPGGRQSDCSLLLQGITKAFGHHMVLRGVDLELRQGDFLTIFGPNGAGKTTLIKILSTISRPSSGVVSIGGFDTGKQPVEARRHIGVVSHDTMLYGNLTARENLAFFGKMYDVPQLEGRVRSLLNQVGLEAAADRRVGTFSHGMQKRLSIARAFIHNPPVLLLDEPETGLDQQGISMLAATLQALGTADRTIVMTTHSLERGLRSGSHVAILARGRIVYREAAQRVDSCRFPETYRQYTEAKQ